MGHNKATSLTKAKASERRRQAVELRLRGKTFYDIGQEMGGISEQRAYTLVTQGLQRSLRESASELIDQQYNRLRFMFEKLLPRMEEGQPMAMQAGVKIVQQICKLFGIEAPSRHEITGKGGTPLQVPAPVTDGGKLAEILKMVVDSQPEEVLAKQKIMPTLIGDRPVNGDTASS